MCLDKRMGLFVAASDESYSRGNSRGHFLYGGFLAPSDDWTGNFARSWSKNVLEGPAPIPYLHMSDIRRPEWREKQGNGITRAEGERRVRAAFELIEETPSLTPIATELNAGHMLDTFTERIQVRSGGKKKFMPDYLAFIAYVYLVLEFCSRARPEAEKVDFLVEKSGKITSHIQEFYENMPKSLSSIGAEHLVRLLGKITPGGKEHIPLQAADVLCWYSQRFRDKDLDDKNIRRYKVIAMRKGVRVDLTDHNVNQLWEAITS